MIPGVLLLAVIGAAAGMIATRLMRVDADLPTAMGLGVLGALVGGFALRLILTACHATVVPNQLALSFAEAAYDDKDRLKHAADIEAMGAMVRQLIEFSQRMT